MRGEGNGAIGHASTPRHPHDSTTIWGGRRISRRLLVVHEREGRFVAREALALPSPGLPPLTGVDQREAGVAHGVKRDLGDIEPARALYFEMLLYI
jgi:hypothetical protein